MAAVQKLTQAHKDKGLNSFVVFMGGPEMKPSIEKVAAEKGITIPVTVLPGGAGAPDVGRFKVNPEAKNTILLYNNRKIRGNFVNVTHDNWGEVEKTAAQMLQ